MDLVKDWKKIRKCHIVTIITILRKSILRIGIRQYHQVEYCSKLTPWRCEILTLFRRRTSYNNIFIDYDRARYNLFNRQNRIDMSMRDVEDDVWWQVATAYKKYKPKVTAITETVIWISVIPWYARALVGLIRLFTSTAFIWFQENKK